MNDTTTRSHEHLLEIDAPVEAVWKALTEAEELTAWFPLEARVEPGEGGSIHLAWDEHLAGSSRILAWDPGRHLRIGWFDALDVTGANAPEATRERYQQKEARKLAVDYYLDSDGKTTRLRLVHSGFSDGAEWDDEYDATRRGWNFELRSLRHYLEHHRGRSRDVLWIRRPVDVDPRTGWDRLFGVDGLMRSGQLSGDDGDPYRLTTVDGDEMSGLIRVNDAPHEFAGTVENMGQALIRAGVETWFDKPEAFIWLSSWDLDAGRRETLARRWTTMLERLFPQP